MQGSTAAVKSIIQIIYHGKRPATRLKAARALLRLAKQAREIEAFTAELEEAEHRVQAARAVSLAIGERGSAPRAGHGAKFLRRQQQAIAALLVQRSVGDAARAVGIATSTLYGWMRDPVFASAYAVAAAVCGSRWPIRRCRLRWMG